MGCPVTSQGVIHLTAVSGTHISSKIAPLHLFFFLFEIPEETRRSVLPVVVVVVKVSLTRDFSLTPAQFPYGAFTPTLFPLLSIRPSASSGLLLYRVGGGGEMKSGNQAVCFL